jgi:hypothetical protein
VAFAGVAWVGGFFVGAHHLDKELKVARIGVASDTSDTTAETEEREAAQD